MGTSAESQTVSQSFPWNKHQDPKDACTRASVFKYLCNCCKNIFLKSLYWIWICYNIASVLCFVLFLFFGLEACVILALWPGVELAPLAVEGEVLTFGPPGKSPVKVYLVLKIHTIISIWTSLTILQLKDNWHCLNQNFINLFINV